jgi:hypothetical protein
MEVEEEENTYIWEKKYVGAWEKIDEEIVESKEKGFFKKKLIQKKKLTNKEKREKN